MTRKRNLADDLGLLWNMLMVALCDAAIRRLDAFIGWCRKHRRAA